MILTRRSLFGLIAAPAMIRLADLMPVKSFWAPPTLIGVDFAIGPDMTAFWYDETDLSFSVHNLERVEHWSDTKLADLFPGATFDAA